MLVKPQFRKLILNLRDPTEVLANVPTAGTLKYKGHMLVVVPHRSVECKILHNMGIDAPAPVDYYYNWPGQYKPMDSQKSAVRFMTINRRCYNLSEIGTGKTLTTLWAFDFLRQEKQANKMLVIAPLSTLERTWADEVFKHFPHLNATVLYGSRQRRIDLLAENADIYIINHDGVKIILDDLVKRQDISVITIDELSHVARNAQTTRWKTLKSLTKGREYVWGLTGTPIPNEPTDAWAQCRLITPENVPPHFTSFRSTVMCQETQFRWSARPEALDIVYQAMQPAVRVVRDECLDLPPVMYETREASLTADQKRAFKSMWDDLYAEFNGNQITAVNEGVKMMKLVQICCGSAYSSEGNAVNIAATHRLNVAKEIIEDAVAKTIIFVPFRSALEQVAEFLRQHFSVEKIYGGVSKGERDRIFGAFQRAKDPKVLVAQPAAMSHGLTLTAANVIVWFAPITSAETYEQANGRITRPGQKNNQLIFHILGSRLEEEMYRRLKRKTDTQGLLLDMFRSRS